MDIDMLVHASTFALILMQYLNIKLTDISIPDQEKYPHLVSHISELVVQKHVSCGWFNESGLLSVYLFMDSHSYCVNWY